MSIIYTTVARPFECASTLEGYPTKFYTKRLRPEVQLFIFLYTIFDRKSTVIPLVYLIFIMIFSLKKVSLPGRASPGASTIKKT